MTPKKLTALGRFEQGLIGHRAGQRVCELGRELVVVERVQQRAVEREELDTLLGFLDHHRATLAWKTAGLDHAGMTTTVGASTMTPRFMR